MTFLGRAAQFKNIYALDNKRRDNESICFLTSLAIRNKFLLTRITDSSARLIVIVASIGL